MRLTEVDVNAVVGDRVPQTGGSISVIIATATYALVRRRGCQSGHVYRTRWDGNRRTDY